MNDSDLHETDDLTTVVDRMVEELLEDIDRRLAFEAYADERQEA